LITASKTTATTTTPTAQNTSSTIAKGDNNLTSNVINPTAPASKTNSLSVKPGPATPIKNSNFIFFLIDFQ